MQETAGIHILNIFHQQCILLTMPMDINTLANLYPFPLQIKSRDNVASARSLTMYLAS